MAKVSKTKQKVRLTPKLQTIIKMGIEPHKALLMQSYKKTK